MAENGSEQFITPTTGAKTLPSVEILTGRGFITGKSGSGKSNTASVIAEKLLDHNFNLLIVDPEGEYYGLKERYEMLHVGADEMCDVQVGPQHAPKIAEIALTRNMPVILDVSDFLDEDTSKELIADVVEELYHLEKDVRKPFLLMVEEMQEYLPQTGGSDELSTLLERVAKRGRKRGLGMLGMSQRPSSVDKDFITQCDWMVWHKLTWKNDIDVVRNILGSEKAKQVEDFEAGEGYLMTDWDDVVERVQFKKKQTHDAGATPGLESYDRPDLKSVGNELLQEFEAGTADVSEPLESAEMDPRPDEGLSPDDADLGEFDVGPESPEPSDTRAPQNGQAVGAAEFIEAYSAGDRDVSEMSEDELREFISSIENKNRVLVDEVSELRAILQEVDSAPAQSDTSSPSPTVEDSPQVPASASNGAGDRSSPSSEPRPRPTRPQPPERPPDRSGVAGNLVEFTEMIVYLFKLFVYKLRVLASGSHPR